MSHQLIYTWPLPDTQAICLLQSLGSAGNLSINGHLANTPTAYGGVVFTGISRTISLTSTNDLSAVSFTINGIYNGASVSQTILGPNNNTVYTTSIFDVITSVSSNGAVSNVSVGSGLTGQTHWFKYNYNQDISIFSVQVIVGGTINYTFNITSNDIKSVVSPTLTAPIPVVTNSTTTQFQSFPAIPFYYGNVTVNSSGSSGSVNIIITQTGGC